MSKTEVQKVYDECYIQRKRMNLAYFFEVYNKITGKNKKPTNCSTCIINMRHEFDAWLSSN